MVVQWDMSCSQAEDNGLVLSFKFLDRVFMFWLVHVGIHGSARGSCCPAVHPFPMEIGFNHLASCFICHWFFWLRQGCSSFRQFVRSLITGYSCMAGNPLENKVDVEFRYETMDIPR